MHYLRSRTRLIITDNLPLVKVHPSSLSIEGTLGNLRACDLSLGPDHWWGWLCDLRNQEAESLVQVYKCFVLKCLLLMLCFQLTLFPLAFFQFNFTSYSVGDDDYEGYEFSLSGRLSAVRIVFLYRFVQEVSILAL